MEFFVSPWIAAYALAGLASWYVIFGIECALCGGQLGRHWLFFPFQCLIEEIPCYLPFGRRHRIRFIRERMGTSELGSMFSDKGSLTYAEIREGDRYEEAFWMMMGGRASFWGLNAFYAGLGVGAVMALRAAILFAGQYL